MREIEFPKKDGYSEKPKVFVLGKFESIHLAHRKLLEEGKKISKEKNYELGVMIFPERDKDNFYSIEERKSFLKEFNIDYLMLFEPNKKNFSLSKEDFEKWLKSINVKKIVVGYNFNYGKDREGTPIDFKEIFDTKIFKKIIIENISISSSNLKKSVEDANFNLYKKIMGHYFFYKGEVIKGKGIGKELLMPTLNVLYPKYKMSIPYGIYYSYVIYDGKRYNSLTSVSNNPTFNEEKTTYETYIFDFDKNIYGEEVYVEIIEKFRDPIKFKNMELLMEQLEKDKIQGKRYFNIKKR